MTPTALEEQARLESDLSSRALAGDVDAFTELFAMHERGLQNVAYRVTGSREDAADIAQEAFLRVFARLDTLAERPEVNLSAYLFRTARNLVYDHSGKAGRETLQDDLERSAGADEALEDDPELSRLVDAQVEEVRAANARLPERYRMVLALRELEGMSYDELGAALGVTTAAAGQALVRARMALRKELRLEQIDVDSLDPAIRERLGDISAYIDGELSEPERAEVDELLENDEAARRVKALFEEAGQRYRAWLPFPALLLGDRAARAAEAQGLVGRGAGGVRADGGASIATARRGTGAWAPRTWRLGKVKIGRSAMVLGTLVVLLATAAVTARVGVPVDTSSDQPEPPAQVENRAPEPEPEANEPPSVEQTPAPAVAPAPVISAPAPAVSAAQSTPAPDPPSARPAPRPRSRPAAPPAATPPAPAPAPVAPPAAPPAAVAEPTPTPPPETREPETREPVDPNDPPGSGPDPAPPDPGSVPPSGPGGFTTNPPPGSNSGGGSSGGFAAP